MKFSWKLFISILLLLAITFSVGSSLIIEKSFDNSFEHETNAAKSSYRLVVYSLAAAGKNSDLQISEMISVLKQLDSQSDKSWTQIRLTDGDQVLYGGGENYKFDEDTSESISKTSGATTVSVAEDGKHLLQISGILETGSKDLQLEAMFDISSVYHMRDMLFGVYRRVFVVVIGLGMVMSLVVSKWLARPLKKLSVASREIASGNLKCRADVSSKDEVGMLASDFNKMADELERNINDLKNSVTRQEEFIGSFAHEMKTPMTSIIGYADILRSRDLSDDERREAANYIFSEGKRLENLSSKLLDLLVLKKKDFNLVKCRPARIVEDAAKTMAPILAKSCTKLEYSADDCVCLAEPDLVKTLLINLIDNARKAMNGGGVINVVSSASPEGFVIKVTDNGCGIPQDKIERLTEAFFRVDKSRSRAQGGAGLGLSLCSEIAELHNGSIMFDSAVGKGTTVTVYLNGGRADEE